MADISSGNDDKNVGKGGSFKLFGLVPGTPSRSLSKKKSNPFSRIFSRKKSDNKQSADDNDGDSSSSGDADVGKPEEIDVTKVATQPIVETSMQAKMIANTVVDSIQSISATDDIETKTDANSTLKGLIENPKEKIVEKGKEIYTQFSTQEKASEAMLEKGKEGLKEIFKPLTTLEKTSVDQMLEKSREVVNEVKTTSEEKMEKGKRGLKELVNKAIATHTYEKSMVEEKPPLTMVVDGQEKSSEVNIEEQPPLTAVVDGQEKSSEVNIVNEPSNSAPTLQETIVATVTHSTDREEDTQSKENAKSEDNDCVASLAEGLQKMCASWNNNSKKNV